MACIFGYWSIRGFGEQIRLLLHYLGVEYEEKFYNLGPQLNKEEWYAEKFKLGLDFPNLPYYIDGDLKMTQSAAIMEYIADKYDMLPTCKKNRAILHMLQNDITDFRPSVSQLLYLELADEEKEKIWKELPDKLKQYEIFLGDKQWLTGDEINYPDFSLYEILNQLEKLKPTCLKDFPKLKAYLKRFENLSQLKKYLASSEFKNRK